ncbi:hypothetical protein HK103_007329 [Boothiomyces macroporosus]|uniref:Uncharacterized protein n=1 Tax=Boothiomyces macroporosus TaxID=261099 RepID=A0AAD5Y7M8_9FUNG|nr:hypothetical protein HK103_007329 [Boothiomyces macroporosus]
MDEDDLFDDLDIPDDLDLVIPQQTAAVDPFESDSDFDIEEERINSYLHSPVLSSNASVVASDNEETFDDIEFPPGGVSWSNINRDEDDSNQEMDLPNAHELIERLNRVRNREYGVPYTPPLTCNPPTPIPFDKQNNATHNTIGLTTLTISKDIDSHKEEGKTAIVLDKPETKNSSDQNSNDLIEVIPISEPIECKETPNNGAKVAKSSLRLITLEEFQSHSVPQIPKAVEPQIHRIKRQDDHKPNTYISRGPASIAGSTASSRWATPSLRETKRPPTYRVAFGRTVPDEKRKPKKPVKPQKPTLIRNLGPSNQPKVVGNMTYDPIEQTWKGNEAILKDFEVRSSSKPNFIPSTSQIPTQVGNMVFDNVKMCWVGNELSKEETDLFDEIDELTEPKKQTWIKLEIAEKKAFYLSENRHKLLIGSWYPRVFRENRPITRDTSKSYLYDIRNI